MFVERSAGEVVSLGFEKRTVDLNCSFPFWWSAIVAPEGMQ